MSVGINCDVAATLQKGKKDPCTAGTVQYQRVLHSHLIFAKGAHVDVQSGAHIDMLSDYN